MDTDTFLDKLATQNISLFLLIFFFTDNNCCTSQLLYIEKLVLYEAPTGDNQIAVVVNTASSH